MKKEIQLDLIKEFEAAGMEKPEKKPRKPRETIADKSLKEMYAKVAAAEELMKNRENKVTMISIKGIRKEINDMIDERGND